LQYFEYLNLLNALFILKVYALCFCCRMFVLRKGASSTPASVQLLQQGFRTRIHVWIHIVVFLLQRVILLAVNDIACVSDAVCLGSDCPASLFDPLELLRRALQVLALLRARRCLILKIFVSGWNFALFGSVVSHCIRCWSLRSQGWDLYRIFSLRLCSSAAPLEAPASQRASSANESVCPLWSRVICSRCSVDRDDSTRCLYGWEVCLSELMK
jgi:hypothetical protein